MGDKSSFIIFYFWKVPSAKLGEISNKFNALSH